MQEEWRPVVGQEGRYEVSSLGRVRSLLRRSQTGPDRILAPSMRSGYASVAFYDKGRQVHRVHVLVAEAFIGLRPPGHVVNHKNLDKSDNRACNLEWVTQRENIEHAREHGRIPPPLKGEAHASSRITEADVRRIRALAGTVSQRTLAREYGLTQPAIYKIIHRQAWVHVV